MGLLSSKGLDSDIAKIVQRIPDAKNVITNELIIKAKALLEKIDATRRALGIAPYSPMERIIFLNVFIETAVAHQDHKRQGGAPYFDEHLLGTAGHLIDDQALTGVVTLSAALHHDTPEDLGINPAQLVVPERFNIRTVDLPENLRSIQSQVTSLVDGVTKIKKGTREETARVTFRNFLETMELFGARVGNIKLADRTHNMRTLGAKNKEAQERISRETEEVYIPLAIMLGVRETLRLLVNYCMQIDNPALYRSFEALKKERYREYLDPYRTAIEQAFSQDEKPRSIRRFLEKTIQGVQIREASLADYAVQEIPFRNLTLDDLGVSPIEPLFGIDVITDPNTDIMNAVRYIVQEFASRANARVETDMVREEEKPPKRGTRVNIYTRDLHYTRSSGGSLVFDINDSISRARGKRGVQANFVDTLSNEMKEQIKLILRKSERDGALIFDLAKNELLRPKVSVRTPDDKPIELPRGSTVLDFAAAVHTDLLIGLQGAQMSHHIFDTRFEPIDIFDELTDDTVLFVTSCLARHARDESRIKVDPGWLLFCQTEHAKKKLVDFLRKKDPDGSGQQYLKRITRLFGMTEDVLMENIRTNVPNLQKSSNETIWHQIGRGSLELINFLNKHIFNEQRSWSVTVRLDDRPGIFKQFLEEFESQEINVDYIRHHAKANPADTAGKDEIVMAVSDKSGSKNPFELMKVFLKLSYHYDLSIECPQASALQ